MILQTLALISAVPAIVALFASVRLAAGKGKRAARQASNLANIGFLLVFANTLLLTLCVALILLCFVTENMTLSYALTESQQLRVGYNMRIRRAGIDHLNPYVDERDPLNISYGNPDLESEKSNSVNLNYTLFNSKFNMNASVSHTFVNNAIEQYVFMKPDEPNVSVTTFGNIGKRSQTGLFLYLNWMPIPSIRFFMNGGIDYVKLSSEQGGYSNEGLCGRVFGGLQFNFPKDFRLHLNAGYFMPEVQLQGKRGAFLTNGITLNKDLFNKRLTIALYCKSPFMKTWKISDRVEDQNFVMLEEERKWMRDFGITISYRFGSLKTDLPKVIKGIVNDDVK